MATFDAQNHFYGLIAQNREKALSNGSTTDNVPEGSNNLYFTSKRARNTLSANSPISYDSDNGIISMPAASDSKDGYLSSDDWKAFKNKADSFSGYTGTVKVRNSDNTGTISLTFSNGILTDVKQ
jgi:hypothetical protein